MMTNIAAAPHTANRRALVSSATLLSVTAWVTSWVCPGHQLDSQTRWRLQGPAQGRGFFETILHYVDSSQGWRTDGSPSTAPAIQLLREVNPNDLPSRLNSCTTLGSKSLPASCKHCCQALVIFVRTGWADACLIALTRWSAQDL